MTKYRDKCGPAAIAALTGWGRDRAARTLERIEPPSRNGSTTWRAMLEALKDAGFDLQMTTGRPYDFPRITVRRWVAEHPRGNWLLLASNHFLAVSEGRVIEDNGIPTWRGHVRFSARVRGADDPVELDQTVLCRCHCGGPVRPGRLYLPGHDSKHLSALAAQVAYQYTTHRQARRQLPTDGLRRKLDRMVSK